MHVKKRILRLVLWAFLGMSVMLTGCAGKKDGENEENERSMLKFTDVSINDDFWSPRQKLVMCKMIEVGIKKVEDKNGGLNNFIEAAKQNNGEAAAAFEGDVYFLDSDAYKMIEAMSYALTVTADSDDEEIAGAKEFINSTLDKWIPYIIGAQESDGYLDTYFTLKRGTQSMSASTSETNKWTDFAAHEFYVMGHFYEAAVAHFDATGSTALLDTAIKNADLVCSLFGENGKYTAVPGHQEIELALLKLASACEKAENSGITGEFTGEYGTRTEKYVSLARRFLNLRGDKENRTGYFSFNPGDTYRQDHLPVSSQYTGVGHVVRAMYQYIAMTDLTLMGAGTDENCVSYDTALQSLWDDITNTKTFITGGMGTINNNESFGNSYSLSQKSAYAETCGSIGSVIWNSKMNLLYGDSKYIDTLETALYNGVLSGVNFDGDRFFYQNPLYSDGNAARSEWFGCACCPPNLMRLIMSLGNYIYATDSEGIIANMFIGSTVNAEINGAEITLTCESEMPFSGNVKYTVNTDKKANFVFKIRIPAWCEGIYSVSLNDKEIAENDGYAVNDAGYICIDRKWKDSDTVTVNFNMEAKRIYQSDKVSSTKGYTAIKRGPLVYAAESMDNDFDLSLFTLPVESEITEEYVTNLTGGDDPYGIKGGVRLTTQGTVASGKGEETVNLTLIPYYAWNNRGTGMMRTFFNESNKLEYKYTNGVRMSASYTSVWQKLSSINDENTSTFWCSWCENEVKENPWVECEFETEKKVSGCLVNWFEDSADTRVPSGIMIEYYDGSEWKEVTPTREYTSFKAGTNNMYSFSEVTAKSIRMTIYNTTLNGHTYAVGINEWSVAEGR